MNSKHDRLSLLFRLGLLAGLAVASSAPRASAARIDPAPYMRRLALIGGDLRDLQADIDVRMKEMESPRMLDFKVRLAFKMPDSSRMDVVSSSSGMFRGWKFARIGSNCQMYDPISERTTSLDFSKVTGEQPIRVDLGIDMSAGIFRPQNFTATVVGPAKLDGKPALLLKLLPRTTLQDPNHLGKLAYILVWMDPARKIPLQQESYGSLPRLPHQPFAPKHASSPVERLFHARFTHFKPAGPGLWYPDQVEVERTHPRNKKKKGPDRIHLTLARVNGTLFPTEISTTGGENSADVRYSHIRINAGVPASLFHIQE